MHMMMILCLFVIDEIYYLRYSNFASSLANSEQIVSGPYFLRAGSLWQKIEQWCDDGGRSKSLGRVIKSSLLPGRKVNQFYLNGNSAGWLAFQAVYAFYAGQCDSSSDNFIKYSGLFGAFQGR
jgi:hypothetical protein